MPVRPQSRNWRADRALLLVHGVGNAQPGSYGELLAEVESLLGAETARTAVYVLYYDELNDLAARKTGAAAALSQFIGSLQSQLAAEQLDGVDPAALGQGISEIVGDVVWPVLLAEPRNAIRASLIAQLQQIALDGQRAGIDAFDQHVSIIAHSLGCFHTYEALHTIAQDPSAGLSPGTWGVRYDNVIMMASPVKLIATVAGSIRAAVPQPERLYSISQPLGVPQQTIGDSAITSARRFIAITGNLDPVGGNFFRAKPEWAYMEIDHPTATTVLDQQQLVSVNGSTEDVALRTLFRDALRERDFPDIQPPNPHSWLDYVKRHREDLRNWILHPA